MIRACGTQRTAEKCKKRLGEKEWGKKKNTVLKLFSKKQDGTVWTAIIWPRSGSCEHGNEP
jgi:hypothetical protein